MTLAVEKTFAVQGVQIPDSSLAREITQSLDSPPA